MELGIGTAMDVTSLALVVAIVLAGSPWLRLLVGLAGVGALADGIEVLTRVLARRQGATPATSPNCP